MKSADFCCFFTIILTDLLIFMEVSLAHFPILFKFVVKSHIFLDSTLPLILNQSKLHFQLIKLPPTISWFLPTLFRPEVNRPINRLFFLFQHRDISLFLLNNFLNGHGLNIPILPWAQGIDILNPFFIIFDLDIWRLKGVNNQSDSFINLSRFEISKLLGNGLRWFYFERNMD